MSLVRVLLLGARRKQGDDQRSKKSFYEGHKPHMCLTAIQDEVQRKRAIGACSLEPLMQCDGWPLHRHVATAANEGGCVLFVRVPSCSSVGTESAMVVSSLNTNWPVWVCVSPDSS